MWRVIDQLSKAVRGSSMATSGLILLKKANEKRVTYNIINVLLVCCKSA
jgi:hypothetical protein